jgi:hypothetical protein
MGWEVEVSVEEEATDRVPTVGGLAAAAAVVHRGVMVTGIAPAVMRLCLLRRVNASSATRLSLPLVGMEVPEPVMEVSVARNVCMYSL